MNRELLEDLRLYFEQLEDRTHEVEMFYQQITNELESFQIASISREDIASRGFDAEEIYDCDMKELAAKMGQAYKKRAFWKDVEKLSGEYATKFRCPKCWSEAIRYKRYGQILTCTCGHKWSASSPTGRFVLTTLPFFIQNAIGIECYAPESYGARYIPEEIYTAHTDTTPTREELYVPVTFPESEPYIKWENSDPEKFAQCEYISPVLDYGVDALWVPQRLIERS